MPNELHAALDQLWADLLLSVGWALIAASGVALAICVLGGCLSAVDRRRAERDRRLRSERSPQPIVVLETQASQPALRPALVQGMQISVEGIDPVLYGDTAQMSEQSRIHHL